MSEQRRQILQRFPHRLTNYQELRWYNNNMSNYTVKSGDTLSRIAASNGMSLSTLEALNPQISNFNSIQPGQSINLSSSTASTPTWQQTLSSTLSQGTNTTTPATGATSN